MIFNSDIDAQNEKSLTFVEHEGVSEGQSCKCFYSSKLVVLRLAASHHLGTCQ